MSWKYRKPLRSDFDTEEEYEDALAAYESEVDDYISWYEERHKERDQHTKQAESR